MRKHSNGIAHCYPDIGPGICKLFLSSFPQSCSRFTMWEQQLFWNTSSVFVRHLPPTLPSPSKTTSTLTCFWVWRNPPHIQIEVIRARKDVLLRIKIKAVYNKVSPEWCYCTIDLLPPNQKREKRIICIILHTSLIILHLNGDEVPAQKCCLHKWTKIEKHTSYI